MSQTQLKEETQEQILKYDNGSTVWHMTDACGCVASVIKDKDGNEIYSTFAEHEAELLMFYENMFGVSRERC